MKELLLIGANWCAPCKKQTEICKMVAEEAGIKFRKLDVEADKDEIAKYEVKSVPTTILLKDEVIQYVWTGVNPKKDMLYFVTD